MTTFDTTRTTSSTTAAVATEPAQPTSTGLLTRLGGLCLAAGPVLFVVGEVTAPHSDGTSKKDYAASLADHPFQMALSANFLHYSWFFFAFGLLAAIMLVPAGRGRRLTCVSAVAGAIGAIQISGLLLFDFFTAAVANRFSVADAVAIQDDLGTSVAVWLYSAQVLALLPPLLVFAGLARAKVLRWWMVAMPMLGVVGFLGLPLPLSLAVLLVAWTPAYVAARYLVTGTRPARATA